VFDVKVQAQSKVKRKIDSLINTNSDKPFNGVILVKQKEKILYENIRGLSDIQSNKKLNFNDQFVIGSISKQFTAVLILKAFDEGKIRLDIPISRYLPTLNQKWADSVTIHQLLTHTHGIINLEEPLAFKAGSQYAYSQIGFDLLSQILENVQHQSFSSLSNKLFEKCKMFDTFHPDIKKYKKLVNGYTENTDGKLVFETETFENYVAAGGFISSANDLAKWNEQLHNGKLLNSTTYQMMITKQPVAIRQHPLFGKTEYGYGITVGDDNELLQYGQTGFTPGFISMDFYFPATKTSVIVLDNFVWTPNDLKKAFSFHTAILQIIKESL
jgi:CubicO group peptidase (beta-lactamase class C family)